MTPLIAAGVRSARKLGYTPTFLRDRAAVYRHDALAYTGEEAREQALVLADHYEQVADALEAEVQQERELARALAAEANECCHRSDGWEERLAERFERMSREALHGLAPTHRCPACGALWRQCDDASWNLRSALCCGLCDAGRVELVRLLDEPKREPLSDWRIGELYRQWLKEPRTTTLTDLMRSVERAHGIGGSDAE